MSGASSIEWTDATWSPVVGCTRVSPGCDNCYAALLTKRLEAMGQAKYAGLVNPGKGHFNGVARLHAPDLDAPLRWRKPRKVFVNPMSDLFHEALSDEAIAAVFGVMAACPQHTFQVLTKRPERARKWFEWLHNTQTLFGFERARYCAKVAHNKLHEVTINRDLLRLWDGSEVPPSWPLPNVWLGVSVEDQATADERIPLLLQTPAAKRFVSYEPALGPVQFGCGGAFYDYGVGDVRLDWIIVGGESGPGARPFDLAWARSVVEQCREAGVACFVKQLGARPFAYGTHTRDGLRNLRDRKGGDWNEWPEDLRVREFPA